MLVACPVYSGAARPDDRKGCDAVAEHDDEMADEEATVIDVPPLQPGIWEGCDELAGLSTEAEIEAVVRQRESLRRRLADQKLRDALAAGDFAGGRYQRFETALASYGISVLRGWMYSGYIFQATAGLRYSLKPTDAELEELARDSDAREELANMTVAVTLPKFREQARVNGGWKADGGASLPTFFVGATKYVFPNEFRSHRRFRSRYGAAARATALKTEVALDPLSDPASLVPGEMHVLEIIRGLGKRTGTVLALHLHGYSHEEIAELLGLPTGRAVEGILYRARGKARKGRSIEIGERGDSGE